MHSDYKNGVQQQHREKHKIWKLADQWLAWFTFLAVFWLNMAKRICNYVRVPLQELTWVSHCQVVSSSWCGRRRCPSPTCNRQGSWSLWHQVCQNQFYLHIQSPKANSQLSYRFFLQSDFWNYETWQGTSNRVSNGAENEESPIRLGKPWSLKIISLGEAFCTITNCDSFGSRVKKGSRDMVSEMRDNRRKQRKFLLNVPCCNSNLHAT